MHLDMILAIFLVVFLSSYLANVHDEHSHNSLVELFKVFISAQVRLQCVYHYSIFDSLSHYLYKVL